MSKLIKDFIKSSIISLLLLLFCLSICSFVLTKYDFEITNYKYISFLVYALISAVLGFIFKDSEKFPLLIIPLLVLSVIPSIIFKSVSVNLIINIILSAAFYYLTVFLINKAAQKRKKDIKAIRRKYAKKR